MTDFNIDAVPEADRERVTALIPNSAWAEQYVPRGIMGLDDFDYLDRIRGLKHNTVLVGPTGSAKTMFAKAYAAKRGVPFARVNFNGAMDPTMVLGFTTIGDDGEVTWVDGDATLVFRYGGVLLLDEVNLMQPKLTAAFHQALDDDRRFTLIDHAEVVQGHDDLTIIGAYNDGYTGTARLNEAFVDRFHAPLDWDYDPTVEHQLVGQYSARLLETAVNIRTLTEVRTPVSTRTLVAFLEQYEALGIEAAVKLFTNRFDASERPSVTRAMEAQSFAIDEELTASLV